MTIRAILASLIMASVGGSAASAQPSVSGADLFVDLDQFIDKQVILTDAEVFGADNGGAYAISGELRSSSLLMASIARHSAISEKLPRIWPFAGMQRPPPIVVTQRQEDIDRRLSDLD